MEAQKICNFKYGETSSLEGCSKSSDGRCLAKCNYHLNLAHRKSRKARAKKSKNPIFDKAAKNDESRLSMKKFRETRKLQIVAIKNDNILRISALIDRMKSHQEYVIVPNVISGSLMASEIKLKGRSEPINFSQKIPPWTQFM